MEFFILYLFVRLEELSQTFSTLGAAFLAPILVMISMFLLAWGMEYSLNDHKEKVNEAFLSIWKKAKPVVYVALTLGIIFNTIGSLLPTPKQAAIIFAGGTAYQAVTSEDGKRVLGKIGAKVEAELDKLLNLPDVKEKIK